MDGAVTLPKLLVALGIAGLLIVMWRTRERRRRWRLSLCPACGYDIRSCEERCSECGATIPDDWRDPADESIPGDDR